MVGLCCFVGEVYCLAYIRVYFDFYLSVKFILSSVVLCRYFVLKFCFMECVIMAVSSAQVQISEFVMLFSTSAVYMLNHVGDRTVSCGTPAEIVFF